MLWVISVRFVVLALDPAIAPVKDEAGLAVVQRRLSAALGDVDDVPVPPYARAPRHPYVTGCTSDSGEVFEPSLQQEWRLGGPARFPDPDRVTAAGRRVGANIAAALIARGWAGSPKLTGRDYPATDLTKNFGGYTVRLAVQVFDDSVLLGGYTKYRRVCRSGT